MTYELVIRPEAERDLTEGYWWYEDCRAGLGAEFERCFEEAAARLMRRPESFGIVYAGLRRMQLDGFPMACISMSSTNSSSSWPCSTAAEG